MLEIDRVEKKYFSGGEFFHENSKFYVFHTRNDIPIGIIRLKFVIRQLV